ncbi:glycoside hydrolase family 43 protein [Lacticaseibacillus mingshuiensis]|uniref:Family 43 glycosylhydrolase n=1 Tax=Lacticaseibacillus mingshuiensis TaxID=2799574 RepID=A0ABW4CKH1_9LACO|nr:glycoside hydrolase family 43 protein [Lacticaseibacillus mingshuiensis]
MQFTNPLPDDGKRYADPWLIRVGDTYFYCGAGPHSSILIKTSSSPLDILTKDDHVIWQAPVGTKYSFEVWAPELHFLRGHWYVYFAADDGLNDHHRMYVLLGGRDANDPLAEPYEFVGRLELDANRWAIDGTVLEWHDQLYFIWSGWAGVENVAQNLYIQRLKDPATPIGERILIAAPTHAWEQRGGSPGTPGGLPYVNEGPEVLIHNGFLSIIYSASGVWTDDYCLGQLRFIGSDPMDPHAWQKADDPLFEKTAHVFTPGHCSFITSASGQDYLVYHAAIHQGAGTMRNIRMQPFTWTATGDPVFGQPITPGIPVAFT